MGDLCTIDEDAALRLLLSIRERGAAAARRGKSISDCPYQAVDEVIAAWREGYRAELDVMDCEKRKPACR
jgi:ribosome modulation factor